MKKFFIMSICISLTGCCWDNMDVLLEEPDFQAEGRVLVYENNFNSGGAKKLRASLRQQGIKVLKYTSKQVEHTHEVTKNNEKDIERAIYNKVDGSPYIIELSYDAEKAFCFVPTQNIDYVYRDIMLEITNLTTREVVYSLKAAGQDGECGYCDANVWDRIAEKVAVFWKNSEE